MLPPCKAQVELIPLEMASLSLMQIILEGYITGERASEGPFVDITGTRDMVRQEPVIRLTKMMMRESPYTTPSFQQVESTRC